jgi:hypothetical protein
MNLVVEQLAQQVLQLLALQLGQGWLQLGLELRELLVVE